MPGSLDSCISNVYEDGNIPASVGLPPVRVLLKQPVGVTVFETATANATQDIAVIPVAVFEVAAAIDETTVDTPPPPRDGMLLDVFVNSDGTPRQANVNGVMVNL